MARLSLVWALCLAASVVTYAAAQSACLDPVAGTCRIGVPSLVDSNTCMQPPSGLSYSNTNAVYRRGVAITPNTPTINTGGGAVTYTISPSLANSIPGVALDTSTGIISGTPTAIVGAITFTVTATNAVGTTTATITIAVRGGYSCHDSAQAQGTLLANLTLTHLEDCKRACDLNADCKFVDFSGTTCSLMKDMGAGPDLYTRALAGGYVCIQQQASDPNFPVGYACTQGLAWRGFQESGLHTSTLEYCINYTACSPANIPCNRCNCSSISYFTYYNNADYQVAGDTSGGYQCLRKYALLWPNRGTYFAGGTSVAPIDGTSCFKLGDFFLGGPAP